MDDTTETNNTSVPPAMDVPTANQDARGRFLPGHRLGGSKLTHGRMAQYRKAFHAAVLDEEMHQLAQAMMALALLGDVAAARFVAEYTMGKPLAQELEIETSDTPGQLVINLVSPNVKN